MSGSVEASVVVPTRDRPDDLAAFLDALRRQRTERRFEIVVVDDAVPAGLAVAPEDGPEVRVVAAGGVGPGAARNVGLSHARGRLILFADDDTTPDPGWLEAACRYLDEHPGAVAVEGATVSPPYDHLREYSIENERGGRYITCNIAYRRAVLDELGGFDEIFPYNCEDLDLAFRALRIGPIGFADGMRVVHHPRPISLRELVSRARHAPSEVVLHSRHPERWTGRTPIALVPMQAIVVKWVGLAREEGLGLLARPRRLGRFAAAAAGQVGVTALALARARRGGRASSISSTRSGSASR